MGNSPDRHRNPFGAPDRPAPRCTGRTTDRTGGPKTRKLTQSDPQPTASVFRYVKITDTGHEPESRKETPPRVRTVTGKRSPLERPEKTSVRPGHALLGCGPFLDPVPDAVRGVLVAVPAEPRPKASNTPPRPHGTGCPTARHASDPTCFNRLRAVQGSGEPARVIVEDHSRRPIRAPEGPRPRRSGCPSRGRPGFWRGESVRPQRLFPAPAFGKLPGELWSGRSLGAAMTRKPRQAPRPSRRSRGLLDRGSVRAEGVRRCSLQRRAAPRREPRGDRQRARRVQGGKAVLNGTDPVATALHTKRWTLFGVRPAGAAQGDTAAARGCT